MAEWQRNSLADTGAFKQLAEQGEAAITTVQSVLEVVQGGAEVAKLFLTGVANPAAKAAELLADAIIASLSNYKESGYFLLIINPFDDAYGQKLISNYGFEMKKDAQGNVLFNLSTVADPNSEFLGQQFRVNDDYRRSLKISDLTPLYRDELGRMKDDEGFVAPVPRLVNPPKLVLGGYDPATWKGEQPYFSYLPQMTADKTINLMADAFDDEGDIPRYEIVDKNKTIFGKKGEKKSKVPFTKLGTPLTFEGDAAYDPSVKFTIPLYESGNTSLSTSARGELTTQISAGKPNYLGDTTLTGQTITGLAFVIAAQDPNQFLESLQNVQKLLPQLPDFNAIIAAFKKLLTPDPRKITIRVDTDYGNFVKDDIIKGESSGAIGIIAETPVELEVPVINQTEYTYLYSENFFDVGLGSVNSIQKVSVDTNIPIRYRDYEIEYNPLGDPTNRFLPNEYLFEATALPKQFPDGRTYTDYKIVGEEIKNSNIDNPAGVRLPKYATVRGLNPIAPNSTPPDFIGIKAADFIPGWSDFFDGLIELANGIKGFAEDTSAFIEELINTIDDLLDKFTKLVAALTELISILTTGLPNAGIWYLGMETSTGNEGFKNALKTASNAPDASYVFSAGFLLVGDPVVKELTGGDPLKVLFEPLGVEFQSV